MIKMGKRMKCIKKYLAFILIIMSPMLAFSQMSMSSSLLKFNDFYRVNGEEEDLGMNYKTLLPSKLNPDNDALTLKKAFAFTDNIFISVLYPEIHTTLNSGRNWGGNDRGIWQGRGLTLSGQAGIEVSGKHFLLRLNPEFWASQNLDYEIIPTSQSSGYGDYWTIFDNLQRFGDSSFGSFSFGQSAAKLFFGKFEAGISTESIKIGPGKWNNILLSDNAQGLPHVNWGTSEKIDVFSWGLLGFHMIWGLLEESEYFDDVEDNNFGWFSGLYTEFSPRIMPYLTLGFNHQYYKPLNDWDAWDLVRGVPFLDRSNLPGDTKDMMASLTFEFLLPEVGFQVYGEWARNDNFKSFEDVYKYPEHTQGYLYGFSKVIMRNPKAFYCLDFEFINMAQERTYTIRSAGPWYRHGWDGWIQGFTNLGQLVGASVGPGSDSQILRLSRITDSGYSAITFQRWIHDKDYFYLIEAPEDINLYTEFNVGLETFLMNDSHVIFAKLNYAFLLHNNYIYKANLSNIHISLGYMYKI